MTISRVGVVLWDESLALTTGEDTALLKHVHSSGFTLIELLTVIAIIAILAGLTAAALPRALESARLTDVSNDFNQIRTAMAAYVAQNTYSSFPPGYGFRTMTSFFAARGRYDDVNLGDAYVSREQAFDTLDPRMFVFDPYMAAVDLFGTVDLYDRFADGINTDMADYVGRMEFPIDIKRAPMPYFYNPTSFGDAQPGALLNLAEEPDRPYIYVPVNMESFRILLRAIREMGYPEGIWDGTTWPNNDFGKQVRFFVPRYDSYVLLSVGPNNDTFGVAGFVVRTAPGGPVDQQASFDAERNFINSIPDDMLEYTQAAQPQGISVDAWKRSIMYQALAMRAYYLATRDINENGVLDFDWYARTRQNEVQALLDYSGNAALLPDGSRGAGPIIYVGEG